MRWNDGRGWISGAVGLLAILGVAFTANPAQAIDPATLPANTWVNVTVPSPWPDFRGWNQGVYNPLNRTLLHYDGFTDAEHPYVIYSNSVWSYDLVTNRFTVKTVSYLHGGDVPSDWYPVADCTSPCQTTHPYDRHPYGGFVYDTRDNVVILFGGVNARSGMNLFDDTWAYNPAANTWTNMNPATHPPAREEACMVYTPTTDETIVFDGSCASCDDVWGYKYSTNTWTRKDTPGQVLPTGRRTHSMIYVPTVDRIMLFGGKTQDDTAFLGDTWFYNSSANVWTQMTPSFSPPGRLAPGLAYDTRNQVVMLHGGYGSSGPIDDTWIYHPDTNRWEQINPPVTPGALGRTAWHLTYDQSNGVFLLWEYASSMWVFKYVPSGQTSDQIAPAAIRNLH